MSGLLIIATSIGYVAVYLIGLLLIAFLTYCLYVKYIHLKYDHIPGPPRDSFLFGHGPTMLKEMGGGRIMHNKFLEWAQTYGPVYRINSFHYVLISVYCPEATKEFLMSQKYLKSPVVYKQMYSLFGQRFLGTGLVTAQGHEHWYKQRRMMDPAFSSQYLRGLMGTFNERADLLIERLEEMADSHADAPMHHLFNCFTMDVIAKIAFGVELDLLKKSDSPFPNAVVTCLEGLVAYLRRPFFQFFPWNWKFVRRVKDAVILLRSTGAKWINKRKRAIQNGEDVPKDILTQILRTAEELTDIGDEELMIDNFMTFFIAGQETTANQLAFALMELGRHPDIVSKLKDEVDDVIGMKQEISYEDLGKLTYLTQVLKETLRIYPTAPGTSRWLDEDTLISGYLVPRGVTVILSSYTAGRLEQFFKDPLKFDPDRFHPDAPKPYYCYYPFALGPRSCLGMNFSQMEAKVAMAKLLQRFEFSLVPGQSFDIIDTGTLRPKGGVVCTIRHRGQTTS